MCRVLMCEGKNMICNGSFSTADDQFITSHSDIDHTPMLVEVGLP